MTSDFQIVNLISIAGMQGSTSIRNSDYSASKAALASWSDALRQELIDEGSEVNITNIYPYIFDSQLFSGFSGLALNVIPLLKTDEVAERVYAAIVNAEMEVYIPWYSYWMCVLMLFLPVKLSMTIR